MKINGKEVKDVKGCNQAQKLMLSTCLEIQVPFIPNFLCCKILITENSSLRYTMSD